MQKVNTRWTVLIGINVVLWCVLSFYGTTGAAPRAAKQPFSNAVEQRHEMVRQLKEIKSLIKEQNALLRSLVAKTAQHDPRQR